eukprot:jgi/Mesvir1/22836/Mv20096-RA.1
MKPRHIRQGRGSIRTKVATTSMWLLLFSFFAVAQGGITTWSPGDLPSQPILRGSLNGFLTYTEVLAFQVKLATQYPHLVSDPVKIGYSSPPYSIPIYATRMTASKAYGTEISQFEPAVTAMVTSMLHARDPASLHTTVALARYMAREYGHDMDITYLLDNGVVWLVFIANPSGYEQNREEHEAGTALPMHHMNTAFPCPVDLNHNFGYKWGSDKDGPTSNCHDDEYRGTAPFSEPESRALRDFVIAENITHSLNFAAYGGTITFPWSLADMETDPDSLSRYTSMAGALKVDLPYTVNSGSSAIHYAANGEMDGWLWEERGIWAFSVKVGKFEDDNTGYWPPVLEVDEVVDENVVAAISMFATEAFRSGLPIESQFRREDIIIAFVVLGAILGLVMGCWCCCFFSIMFRRCQKLGSLNAAFLSVQTEFCCCSGPRYEDPDASAQIASLRVAEEFAYEPETTAYYPEEPPAPAPTGISWGAERDQRYSEYEDEDDYYDNGYNDGYGDGYGAEVEMGATLGEGMSASSGLQRMAMAVVPSPSLGYSRRY